MSCSDPSCPLICDDGCRCHSCLAEEAKMEACTHYKVTPKFDEEKAQGLDSHEVKSRWPRFSGMCPDCGWHGIMYASYSHYIHGDW